MTVEQMRAALGLGNDVSDAAVVAAYAALSTGGDDASAPRLAAVDLEEAKLFCRLTHDEDDQFLVLAIAAATDAACDVADDWDGSETIPARVKLAVLNHVAAAYDGRGDGPAMPAGSVRLLQPLRRLDI